MNEPKMPEIVEQIIDIQNCIINAYYTEEQNYSIEERYERISIEYDKLIQFMKDNTKYFKDAEVYYIKRGKNDKELNKVQEQMIDIIETTINNDEDCRNIQYEIVTASSFSAKTNLIDESDIDLVILIKDIDNNKIAYIGEVLKECNFEFVEKRNKDNELKRQAVFNTFKYINNDKNVIEIESKVMNYYGFQDPALKMHKYIDNKMGIEEKIVITYLKKILKENNLLEDYENLKMLYYISAGHKGGATKLLYKLR
tara:strand:+ start:1545 stop:2309 length:765 start_codon:yes stop_codon:yes gene_type:complete